MITWHLTGFPIGRKLVTWLSRGTVTGCQVERKGLCRTEHARVSSAADSLRVVSRDRSPPMTGWVADWLLSRDIFSYHVTARATWPMCCQTNNTQAMVLRAPTNTPLVCVCVYVCVGCCGGSPLEMLTVFGLDDIVRQLYRLLLNTLPIVLLYR